MRLSNGEALFRWPLDYHVITAGFKYNDGTYHRAIDLRTKQNNSIVKPVYAAEDMLIDQVQHWDGKTKTGMQSYGEMIRGVHAYWNNGSLATRYAHLSKILVKVGQYVKEGDIIGYTGDTGNTFGAHLHFEVIYNGVRTNPLVWLDNDFTVASNQVYTFAPGEHSVDTSGVNQPSSVKLYKFNVQTMTSGDIRQFADLATKLKLSYTYVEV